MSTTLQRVPHSAHNLQFVVVVVVVSLYVVYRDAFINLFVHIDALSRCATLLAHHVLLPSRQASAVT